MPMACGKCGSKKGLRYETALGELSCIFCGWLHYVPLLGPTRVQKWLRLGRKEG